MAKGNPTPSHTPTSIPTYIEQLDGILADVQHLRMGVKEARELFLKMMDHAVITTLQEYQKDQQREDEKPRIHLLS